MIDVQAKTCVQEKVVEKSRKYQELAFELRERRPGFPILIFPVVIVCLRGGMEDTMRPIRTIITNERNVRDLANDMLRTVLYESEFQSRKVMSGLCKGLSE